MLKTNYSVPKILKVSDDEPEAWLRTLEHAYPLAVLFDWVSQIWGSPVRHYIASNN